MRLSNVSGTLHLPLLWAFLLNVILVHYTNGEREPSDVIRDHVGHNHAHRRFQEPRCGACLDARLVRHYEVRGCIPVIHAQCQCPSRFRCPVDIEAKPVARKSFEGRSSHLSGNGDADRETSTSCFYNGTSHELLASVRTSDPCRVCLCAYLADGTVGIECDSREECPASNDDTPSKSVTPIGNIYSGLTGRLLAGTVSVPSIRLDCYDFYNHDVCCPSRACAPVDARTGRSMISGQFCNYLSHQYRLGEKIRLMEAIPPSNSKNSIQTTSETPSEETETENELERENSPQEIDASSRLPTGFLDSLTCLHCICTGSWNNSAIENRKLNELTGDWLIETMGDSCRVQRCEMQFDPRFRSGCIPVYEADSCCPVDFLCPARSRSLALKIRGMDAGSKLCRFEGRKYQVGSDLYLSRNHRAAPCIECTCMVPPDFTCVRRKNCNPKQQS